MLSKNLNDSLSGRIVNKKFVLFQGRGQGSPNYLYHKFGTKSTVVYDTGYGEKLYTSRKCLHSVPSLPSTVPDVPHSKDPLFYPLQKINLQSSARMKNSLGCCESQLFLSKLSVNLPVCNLLLLPSPEETDQPIPELSGFSQWKQPCFPIATQDSAFSGLLSQLSLTHLLSKFQNSVAVISSAVLFYPELLLNFFILYCY